MRPIVFFGMMGSGKTTIGKKLAMDLNLSWVDTDLYIENTKHQSISSIFETQGESYFRDCETNALQQLINHPGVISTGGGIIVRQENRQLLTEHTLVIFLETEITTLIKRLDINNRPLLQNEMIETKLTSLYKARENFYRDCAHITVKTDHLTVAEVVEQIKNQMNQ